MHDESVTGVSSLEMINKFELSHLQKELGQQ